MHISLIYNSLQKLQENIEILQHNNSLEVYLHFVIIYSDIKKIKK